MILLRRYFPNMSGTANNSLLVKFVKNVSFLKILLFLITIINKYDYNNYYLSFIFKVMERVVKTMFPKEKIERNDKTLGLVSELGNPLEIDCYLPEFKLGFEYQV